ncbi:MAG TPA: flagellar hook capping protein [Clostridiales bacterium]|nr:flagellar hook capping protein [Clostridiales bacterium]
MSGLSSANVKTVGSASRSSDGSLGMDDFMRLLITQLTNQDPMSPIEDTQFIAQMAQFNALKIAQTQAEISLTTQGISLVGKEVIVSDYDNNGGTESVRGVVESVRFFSGECRVVVNGKEYPLSRIMEVVSRASAE